MRAVRVALILSPVVVLAGVAVWYVARQFETPPPPPPPAGRLVVLVVFGQLRGDVLENWAPHFGTGGFARLKKDGWIADAPVQREASEADIAAALAAFQED